MKQRLLVLLTSLFIAAGLQAQTHFPIRNPGNLYGNGDTSAFEKLNLQWNAGLNTIQTQLGATNWDYQAFTSYYQSSIDSEKYAFFQGAKAGSINASNIGSYISSKQQKIKALYNNFITMRSNNNFHRPLNGHPLYPNNDTPPSCNANCTNMDFSAGNFTGWYGYYAQNASTFNYSITGMTGGYLGAAQKGAHDPITNTYQMHITQAATRDWFLNNYHGIHMSQGSPWGTGYSVMLGDSIVPDAQVATMVQEFEVTASDNSMTYAYSVLLENPSHPYYEQPFFSVTLFDSAGDTIKNCGEYFVSSGPGLPGFVGEYNPAEGDTAYWRDWTRVNIPLGSYIGQCVTIQFQVGDCSQGGHFGYAYVDASCENLVITASSPSGSLCGSAGTIDLYGPAGESAYQWYGPNNSIITNDTLQNVTVDSLGTYTLVITPSTGELCKDTIYFKVSSIDTLKAHTALVSPIVCAAGSGSARAISNYGIPPYTYSWSNHQTNDTATGLTVGSYTVTVTDSNNCSASATISLTEPPAIVAIVTYTTATCGYNNGTGKVTASGGTGAYTYSWSPIVNTNATVTGLSAGNYTVTVTDANGCTATGSINMSLNFVTASMGVITDVSCFGGSNGTATVNATGGITPYTYSWSPRGGTGATGTGLTAGSYTVTVKDNSGCSVTALAVITQPTAVTARTTVLTTPPCNGGVGSASVTPGGGTPNYTYSWSPRGGNAATATGLSAGTYTVTITDSHGCTGSATAVISQPATLTVTATLARICDPGSAQATASPSGGTSPYTYLWAPSSQTTATATGVAAGTYTVTVTDKDHCTASATVVEPTQVTATISSSTNILCYAERDGAATSVAGGGVPPYNYSWAPSGGSNASISAMAAGSYTVTITDHNGCTATAHTTLTQPANLLVSVSGSTVRCLGDHGNYITNVSGGTGPYIYHWGPNIGISDTNSPNPTITPAGNQTYTVTVTDAHGCVQYGYETFTFPGPLAVTITGSSVTCTGRYTNMCALPTGGTGGDIFLWEPVNLASSCITIPVNTNTIYTVTVTDNCGVSAKASSSVHVVPPPAVVYTASATQGCAPFCIQFHNLTATIGGKEQYIWNFGDGDSLLEENPIYCYTRSGVYDVTLTVITDSGCASTLTKANLVVVNGSPKTMFTYSPQPVSILSPTVQFTDQSTDEYGIAYRFWNFGDGSDSAGSLPQAIHTYQDTGNYCVTLITVNDKGCSDTATNCLVIEPLYDLYIPSAFTPNGDGLNETFQPVGKYIKNFEMYIFDRWGMELYHTTDINQGWNGGVHNAGSLSQEDTYIYKITVTDAEGNPHSYVGNVTLLK